MNHDEADIAAWEEALGALESLDGVDETTDALHHDVGKYIARIAKNVSDTATAKETLSSSLHGMLIKDFYETHQGRPASVRFEALREALPLSLRESQVLVRVAASLAKIDALETDVRRATPPALLDAIRASLSIEHLLKEIARATRRECERRATDAERA